MTGRAKGSGRQIGADDYSETGLQLIPDTPDLIVDFLLFQRPFRRAEEEADRRLDTALGDAGALVAVHDADRLEVGRLDSPDGLADRAPGRRLVVGEGEVGGNRRKRGEGLEPRRAGRRYGLDPQLAGEDVLVQLALLSFRPRDEADDAHGLARARGHESAGAGCESLAREGRPDELGRVEPGREEGLDEPLRVEEVGPAARAGR